MEKLSKLMRRCFLALTTVTACITLYSPNTALAGSQKSTSTPSSATSSNYTNQLIIRYKDSTVVKSAAAGNTKAALAISDRLAALNSSAGMPLTHHRYMSGNGHVVKLPAVMTLTEAEAVAAKLRMNSDIAYVEPDRRMLPMLTPNDPRFADQWHLAAPASFAGGANLPTAWDITTGSAGIVIAVIDTGILPNHADISGRTLAGYNFISNGVLAGNGVGRSTDSTDLGDFVTSAESKDSNSILFGCDVSDSSWHGTHVTGTIGAASNNGIGVSGINWVSPILPVRALGKCFGFESDIADGMRWAAGLSVSGVPANANPAKVLNLSLGGTGACGTTFQNAVNDVIAAGATVVVAAGNENSDVANSSPANCSGVISVAAVGPAGGRAYYSNTGSAVTIAAPGGDLRAGSTKGVLSTLNSGLTTAVASPGGDIYEYYQGTSMATPHVAGIVSLMLSRKPALTASQVLTLLQSSSRKFPVNTGASGGDCTTALCGTGIIDAAAAVASVDQPIVTTSDVTSVTESSASAGGNVTSAGGSAVTARGLCWGTSSRPAIGGSDSTCLAIGTGTGTFSSTISSLTANTIYYIRAYATNSSGTTYGNEHTFYTSLIRFLPKVSTAIVSSISASGAISGGSISSDGGTAVTARGVCWSVSTNPTTADTCTTDGTGTGTFSSTISGLSAGQTYHVRAYATNSEGTVYGIDQNFSTTSNPPTVLTSAATLVSNSSAASGGNVTLGGGFAVTARGVCWSATANPVISGTCSTDGSGTGPFSSSITGLSANTLYHVRAYATNSNNSTSYGTDLTFRTLSTATTPSVLTTMPVSSITTTTASGGGYVTSDGGATVTARGICLGTSVNPVFGGNCLTNGSGTGRFTIPISSLSPNTRYHIRAYATNSVGTSYGRDVTFTTGKRPVKFLLFAPK